MAKRREERNGHPTADTAAPQTEQPQAPVPEAPPEEDRTNLPLHVIRFGLVRACIWEAHTEVGIRHNVTVSRLYKGGDGLWYSSGSFSLRDLLALAKALDWAHSWISERIASTADVPF